MSKFQNILNESSIGQAPQSISTGSTWLEGSGDILTSNSPIDGSELASFNQASKNDYDQVVKKSIEAFHIWKSWPAPKRGDIVRQIGNKLRENKEALGKLVTVEMGKSYQEGLGEVQEMIDICDMAAGMSRQLNGLTMHSERPDHRMYEQYQPLGPIAIISAFNFPVAVWSWNAMIAAICGDTCIWKPSEKTPLTAISCHKIIESVLTENNVPEGVFNLIIGGREIGELLAEDTRIPLVSATGSTRMGKAVGATVGGRLGRALLELGGNNAIILTQQANLDLAIRAIVFGAVGTCGQRCTSTRRLIIHDSIYDKVKASLVKAYQSLSIGDPMDESHQVGPLIDEAAVNSFLAAINSIKTQGGTILSGGEKITDKTGYYVLPTIAEVDSDLDIVKEETFAPILYLIKYTGELENAIHIQNNVKQGLSSAIFSDNLREAENFLSYSGSDCGIANVNIGTSGAEIGGAFGGEKETGGGRESGSDSWKIYMRRQTNTINWSSKLPLAQGIKFDL